MKNQTQLKLWEYTHNRDTATNQEDILYWTRKYKAIYCEWRGNVLLAMDLPDVAYSWFGSGARVYSY